MAGSNSCYGKEYAKDFSEYGKKPFQADEFRNCPDKYRDDHGLLFTIKVAGGFVS